MERNVSIDWQAIVIEAIARRKKLKFTQEKLALLAGVSKPTLNKFEQGEKGVSIENALKILFQLGLAV